MASKNETVEDVCKLMVKNYDINGLSISEIRNFKDKILATHKRELDRRAIIAGAALADSVDAAYKREVAQLREALRDFIGIYVNGAEYDEEQVVIANARKALEGAK